MWARARALRIVHPNVMEAEANHPVRHQLVAVEVQMWCHQAALGANAIATPHQTAGQAAVEAQADFVSVPIQRSQLQPGLCEWTA